jgi:hypothetical protein
VNVIAHPPHGGPNQQWTYNPFSHEIRSTTQDLVFTVAGGAPALGNHVIVEPSKHAAHQHFELVLRGSAPTQVFGIYRIEAATNPGLVVDIAGAATGDNAKAVVWPSNGQLNQKFRVIGDTISPLHSGRVLDSSGGLGAGHGVIQHGSHGGPNQCWVYDPVSRQIRASSQALVFDMRDGKTAQGTELVVNPPTSSPTQQWRLVLV